MLITEKPSDGKGERRLGAASGYGCAGAMTKQRLDTLMAERGLFPSRSRAAASVMAGEVYLEPAGSRPAGPGRRRAVKPGELVDVEVQVSLAERPSFVS